MPGSDVKYLRGEPASTVKKSLTEIVQYLAKQELKRN